MARALTTAADPAQVADAVFAAMRDELRVDASTFALLDERGALQTLRRFGYAPDDPTDGVLASLQTDGPVLGQNVAFFSETIEDLPRDRPDIYSSAPTRNASGRSPSSRSSCPTTPSAPSWCTGTTTVRSPSPTGPSSSPSPARRPKPSSVPASRSPISSTWSAASISISSVRRWRPPRHRATWPMRPSPAAGVRWARNPRWCASRPRVSAAWPAWPAAATRPSCPAPWCRCRGATRAPASPAAVTVMAGVADDRDLRESLETEIVARVLLELPKPVTIVSEPLIGSVGPLGVLSLAFVGQPEPSEPDLRFLSTLAGLTAQALERAQVFEHEREALRDAEAGRERLSLLSEVTRLLSSSLEPTTVIRRTMSLVEGRLADSCSVQVPGESGLVRLDVREPGPTSPRRPGADEAGRDVLPFDSDAPAAVAFRTGRTQLAPLHESDEAGATGRLHGAVRAADRQRRGHRRDDLCGRAGSALRGGRRLAGHRGGESGRRRPVQRHTVPAGARRGGRPAACRPAGLAARRRGPLARCRVPGGGRRDLRRRRLVRRLRARRRLRVLQRRRRHGQGRPGGRPDGSGAQRRSAPMRSPACHRRKCSRRWTASSTRSSRTASSLPSSGRSPPPRGASS